jgi:hypothetical protein
MLCSKAFIEKKNEKCKHNCTFIGEKGANFVSCIEIKINMKRFRENMIT